MEINPFVTLEGHLLSIKEMLAQILEGSAQNNTVPKKKDLVQTAPAAVHLGLKEQTVRVKASKKEIPHSKVGGRLWFSLSELDEWIRSQKVKTNDELSAEADAHLKKLKRK